MRQGLGTFGRDFNLFGGFTKLTNGGSVLRWIGEAVLVRQCLIGDSFAYFLWF